MCPGEPAGRHRTRIRRATTDSTAAAIYGIIVSAAVMATSHSRTAAAVVVSVVVTLLIYWCAERYARLVAERIHEGHRPSWQHVRHQLTTGWEFVTASALPLAALVMLRLAGVDLDRAVLWALICSSGLLGLAGWEVGRDGRLSDTERLVSAAVTAAFGIAMMVLKAVLH
jgi:hypothetical protein